MSEEQGFESMGDSAIDALYDLGYGAGALVSGEFEVAGDRFLDASGSALDAITDGGFSHLVDRFEGDTGIDTRELVEDGVQYVGEALGEAAWEVTEAAGDALDYVGEVAEDVWSGVEDVAEEVADTAEYVYDTVADTAEDVYDSVADTAEDAYDSVAGAAEDVYDTVGSWFE